MGRRIDVVQYDSAWPAAFELESEKVSLVFEPILESIHHIGSTSVPGLSARPVIDILVVVHDDSAITDYDGRMSGLEYTRGDGPTGETGGALAGSALLLQLYNCTCVIA